MKARCLKEHLFKPILESNEEKNIITTYTSLLLSTYQTKKEGQTEITSEFIYQFLNTPFYVSNKIHSAIKEKESCTIEFFGNWLSNVFNSSVRERIRMLFDLLDFNKDGVINKKDIVFFFNEYITVQYGNKYLNEFNILIQKIIFNKEMTLEVFINFITVVNSDLLYLFYLLIQEFNFYQEKYIKRYLDTIGKSKVLFDSRNDLSAFEKQNELIAPSANLIHFAYETLGYSKVIDTLTETETGPNDDKDEDDDFSALEEFEQNVSSQISGMLALKKITHASNKELIDIKKPEFALKANTIEKKPLPSSAKDLSFSIEHLLKARTMEDYKNDLHQSGIKVKIQKGNGRISKSFITIIDKLLFIQIKSKKTSKYICKPILTLNYCDTNEIIKSQPINSKKVYFKTQLDSELLGNKTNITFYSTKIEKIKSIIEQIKANTNYRSVKDYYIINERVNKGKFGEIFQGVSKANNRKVAIKKISKSILFSSSFWEKEIFILLQYNKHDNVTNCIEFFETSKNIYFIFEYLSYGTLRSLLKSNDNRQEQITTDQKVLFANQLIKAVSFLHKQGIIHRDLKPDNLMIDYSKGNYILKVTDYGLGKIMSPSEITNESFGSLAYSSPEIVSGSYYSFESDIWSIGMIVYFIYSLSDPFDNVNIEIQEIKEMIILADIKWLYNSLLVDKGIISFLDSCFNRKSKPKVGSLCFV